MDWDRLKTFYTVASLGSLSAAEQTLHVTQSALSRQISQLEHEVKSKLFDRHARGLKLTEAGRALFPVVEKVYNDLVAIQANLMEQKDAAEGKLTVIIPRSFGSFWLVPQLAAFKKLYPKIQLTLISDEMISTQHAFREEVYVQISSFPPPEHSDFLSTNLCTYGQHIYGGNQYLDEHGIPQNVKDLDHHQLIVFKQHTINVMIDDKQINPLLYVGRPHNKPRRSDFLVDDTHTKLVATENNLGLSNMPIYLAQHLKNITMIKLNDLNLSGSHQVSKHLFYPQYLKGFERINVFKEFITEKAKEIMEMERQLA